jgi:hypothetical protein
MPKLRPLSNPWTEEECLRLKKLHAAGASPVRAALALKKSRDRVKEKARELGIPFETMHARKRRQKEKEVEARTAAGLSPVQHNPKSRHR